MHRNGKGTGVSNEPIIYVVEDDDDILELIRFNLKMAGFKVYGFSNGPDGLQALKNAKPHVAILDLMLPGMSGLDICSQMKSSEELKAVPVMFVTAKGEEKDIVRGLEMGADDYLTKPFSPQVLVARVKALLRRSYDEPEGHQEDSEMIEVGAMRIHKGRHEVTIDDEPVKLTNTEFQILTFLAQKPGWVFTRGQIVNAIHGQDYAVTDRTIDFQMVGLRKKMGPVGSHIETVRGVGYRFKDE